MCSSGSAHHTPPHLSCNPAARAASHASGWTRMDPNSTANKSCCCCCVQHTVLSTDCRRYNGSLCQQHQRAHTHRSMHTHACKPQPPMHHSTVRATQANKRHQPTTSAHLFAESTEATARQTDRPVAFCTGSGTPKSPQACATNKEATRNAGTRDVRGLSPVQQQQANTTTAIASERTPALPSACDRAVLPDW